MSSVPVPVSARLSSLPDDVLRALATFASLSDLLVLVQCSRHFRVVLLEEHWAHARFLQSLDYLSDPPKQRVLDALFGEADVRGDMKVYCFTDGHSFLTLDTLRNHINKVMYKSSYVISANNKLTLDRFTSWLRYRCEQHLDTETHAHGNTTEVISGDTSDL
jgi:hypothetical protein